MRVFRQAIKEVPKSGEVWCEGARIRLDPTCQFFNLKAAHKFLNFAIEFTPQYGDSFLEYIRLKMLLLGEEAQSSFAKVTQMCVNADPNYGSMWFHCKHSVTDSASQVMKFAIEKIREDLSIHKSLYQHAILTAWSAPPETQESILLRPKKPQKFKLAKGKERIAKWRVESMNSLYTLYPCISHLKSEQRHMALFGSDPITP